jgi:stage III sporulation protein AF
MLSFLKSWIEGIAIAVIVASIFEIILPKGNTKKYIKMILGVYVVFSIISPFVDSNALYNFDIENTVSEYIGDSSNESSSQSSVENDLNEMYIATFEKEIQSTVENQGYTVISCKVDAIFDTDSDDAGIKKITIKLQAEETTDNKNIINDIETIEKVEININNTVTNGTEEENSVEENDKEDEEIDKLKDYLSDHFEIDKNIIYIYKV